MKMISFLLFAGILLWNFPGFSGDQENPEVTFSCEQNGFSVYLNFQRPFRGHVYAAGQSTTSCNFPIDPDEEIKTIFIPVTCGTKIKETGNTVAVFVPLVLKKHGVGRLDDVRPMTCHFPGTETVSDIQQEPIEENDKITAWIELEPGSPLNGTEASKSEQSEEILSVYVNDFGRYKGINVRNCYVHDDEIIEKSKYVVKVVDCSHSDFKVKISTKSDLMIYSKFNASMFPVATGGQRYVSCSVQLCKGSCSNNCGYSSSDISLKVRKQIMKAENVSETSRQYTERHRLMKTTIAALASKLMTYTRRPKVLSTAAIEKRILNTTAETEASFTTTTKALAETSSVLTSVELNEQILSVSNVIPTEILTTVAPLNETISPEISNPDNASTKEFTTSDVNISNASLTASTENSSVHGIFLNSRKAILPSDESRDKVCVSAEQNVGVPFQTFWVATGLLVSIAICLLLLSIVLCIRMRKEQKKRHVDNFLLYNFN